MDTKQEKNDFASPLDESKLNYPPSRRLDIGVAMSSWYADQFESEIDEQAQAAIALAIHGAYIEAAEACKAHFPEFGWRNVVGAIRWFYIEEALMRIRGDHQVLQTVRLPNVSRTHFFGLTRSETTFFTIAKVARPHSKPPRALFRSSLQSPIQLSWLEGWQTLPPAALCALLIHGPYRDDPVRPAFMRIKFMDGNDQYLPEHIDLHQRFVADLPEVEQVLIQPRQLAHARAIAKHAT